MIIIIITVFQSGVYEIQASARRVNRPDRPLARNPDDSPKSGACVLSYPADSGAWRHRPSSHIRQGTPISVMTPPGGAGERIAGQTPHQRPHDREHRDGTDAVRKVLNDIESVQCAHRHLDRPGRDLGPVEAVRTIEAMDQLLPREGSTPGLNRSRWARTSDRVCSRNVEILWSSFFATVKVRA
ncbi:hypothetical protein [Burkholderia paludis]|uniref:hypothetical protein n=1 Tax=Burkholderia paludis TaxID=1506587 RepID=UPI0012699629|nr:hypothetical protein [Burkholderia paludis]